MNAQNLIDDVQYDKKEQTDLDITKCLNQLKGGKNYGRQ